MRLESVQGEWYFLSRGRWRVGIFQMRGTGGSYLCEPSPEFPPAVNLA